MAGMIFVPLFYNGIFAAALVLLIGVFLLIRRKMLVRSNREGLTWDCGYAQPTARMEYTATGFIQNIADLFQEILRQKKSVVYPTGLFPTDGEFAVSVPDAGSRWFWGPVFRAASYVSERVKHLQSGYLHIYILLMVLAILLMLGWSLLDSSAAEQVENMINAAEVIHE